MRSKQILSAFMAISVAALPLSAAAANPAAKLSLATTATKSLAVQNDGRKGGASRYVIGGIAVVVVAVGLWLLIDKDDEPASA